MFAGVEDRAHINQEQELVAAGSRPGWHFPATAAAIVQ